MCFVFVLFLFLFFCFVVVVWGGGLVGVLLFFWGVGVFVCFGGFWCGGSIKIEY